jgi:hypothetical protein
VIEETEGDRQAYARVIAAELDDVVEDLHTIDPADLVSYIRFGSFAAIEDLLQSSAELFFKEGTLTFGWTADVDLTWEDAPKVTLGLEFNNRAVSVFFNLSLHALKREVEIAGVRFDPERLDSAERLSFLSEAIADARLPKRLPRVQAVQRAP